MPLNQLQSLNTAALLPKLQSKLDQKIQEQRLKKEYHTEASQNNQLVAQQEVDEVDEDEVDDEKVDDEHTTNNVNTNGLKRE